MRTLIVGSWVTATYEEQLFQAFKQLSHDVHAFRWGDFFNFVPLSNTYDSKKSKVSSIWNRFQNKFIVGPSVVRINTQLLKKVRTIEPDVVFLYRATHIWPSTIRKIKKLGVKVMIYNNDDPFTAKLPKYVYRNYLKSLKYADWIFSYRSKNIDDYAKLGFTNTSILRSSYTETNNFQIPDINKEYDIIFIGHFENDGRDEVLLNLLKQERLNVGLWGQNWRASKYYNEIVSHLGYEIGPLFGKSYNETINKAKMALVFFSKINNDGYTRRCFEIPAAKTMMLCEYTKEISTLFKEGSEVEFFRDNQELMDKVLKYSSDKELLASVSNGGYNRLIKDGHEIKDRAKEIIDIYNKLI